MLEAVLGGVLRDLDIRFLIVLIVSITRATQKQIQDFQDNLGLGFRR